MRLTYQTHLTVGICPEKYLLTVGICPNFETESRMTRTFPHGHLYFSRQIPTVNVFKLWIRTLLNSFSKLMEGVTAFLAVFYVLVYKPFLQKTWKTYNLYFPIKHLLSYVVGFPKLWLYLVNFYPCLYNLPNLVEQSDSVISYDDRAVRECRGVHLINVMCVDKWTVRLT